MAFKPSNLSLSNLRKVLSHVGCKKFDVTFISYKGGYSEIRRKELLAENVNTSTILTHKITWYNIGVTIFISLVILAIQIRSCIRDEKRDLQVLTKAKTDSLQTVQGLKNDSMHDENIRRAIQELHFFSKEGFSQINIKGVPSPFRNTHFMRSS